MSRIRPTLLIGITSSIAFSACFPFGPKSVHVTGPYALVQWEDHETYYLVDSPGNFGGGGTLDGRVINIGWSANQIIAERAAIVGGDRGWMHIAVMERRVSGPFTWADLMGRFPEARTLRLHSAAEAWQALR
jgi:hypothetical protein